MRINWIFSDSYTLPHDVSIEKIKDIGPSWGSWRTWRSCGSDNVICHDLQKCQELIQRAFQAVCNFYVPKNHYQKLGRPIGVKLYEGDFNYDIDHHEDIVAMHLVVPTSDLVLLVGFDLSEADPESEKYDQVKQTHYRNLIRTQIAGNSEVQWVLISDKKEMPKDFKSLGNFSTDTLENALKLLF